MGYFDKFVKKGIPFMEGREKGDLSNLVGQPLHIVDFGFIDGNDGEFAVIQFKEDAKKFYFGNSIVTEMLQEVQKDGMEKELAKQVIKFSMRTSKTGREYMAFDFES